MSQEKSQAELLKEELFFEKKHFSNQMSDEELAKADSFCEGYKDFLQKGKTERESFETILKEFIADETNKINAIIDSES